MNGEFQVNGQNSAALFTLKLHRGDGMTLVAMNWKKGKPPEEFVGFAIEYKEPDGEKFFALKNRLSFPGAAGAVNPNRLSSRLSPIQKFRWVHFPRNAELDGEFVYRVTPVFMNDADELSYGEAQEAAIELRRETYPKKLNVTYTRGFVSSQAFVDRYVTEDDGIETLIPAKADEGLDFIPTHPNAVEALAWMGFEARDAILEVLDGAIKDKKAQVHVVAYDLSEREVVSRLQKLGKRLRIIIDDSADHGLPDSAESEAAKRLKVPGEDNVKRQHMSNLQHSKTIVVDGPKGQVVVCGSTNFTWRGFFVQSNNALILRGKTAVKPFLAAFDDYWQNDKAAGFGQTASARKWINLGLVGINAKVAFSPHLKENALLQSIADDIGEQTKSCLFYSLAFLHQTKGPIRDAIREVSKDNDIFVYGISDRKVKDGGGLDLQTPNGNVPPVFPAALAKNLPEPFKSEPTGLSGGVGTRMHHKFVVIDFDKPTARVYLGSYNFSSPADIKNGENLLLIRDRRIAVSYMIEALRIFDHYHFRVVQQEAKKAKKKLQLSKPPRTPGDEPWWTEDYTNVRKIRDRELFS